MQNKKKSSEHSITYNLSNIDHYGVVKFNSGKEVEVTISAFSDFEITTDSLQVMVGDENYFNDCSVTYIKDSYGKNASARIIIPKDITSKKKDILIVASAKRYIANVNYSLTGITASVKPDRFIIGEALNVTLNANESYEILMDNISIMSNGSNVDYTYETTNVNDRITSVKLSINTNDLSDNIIITANAVAYDSTFDISYNIENIEMVSCPNEAVIGTEVEISFKAKEGYWIKNNSISILSNDSDVTNNCNISNNGTNAVIIIPQSITADGYNITINALASSLNINYNLEYCNIVYPYNPKTYAPGDIVTIQIDADGYYSLNNINITDESGNVIDCNITYTSDNGYNTSAIIKITTDANIGDINIAANASKYIYYMRDELKNMKDKSSTYTIFSMGSTASTIFEAKDSCEIIKENIKSYYDDGMSRVEITPSEIKELAYTDNRLTKVEVVFDGTITNHKSDIVVVAEAVPYVNEYTITYDFSREIYGSGYPDELTILNGETFNRIFATEWGTQPYYGNEIVYQTIDLDSFKVTVGGKELNKDLYTINITSYANQRDTNYQDKIGATGINVIIDGQYITGDVVISMVANKYSKVDMQIGGLTVTTTIDGTETTFAENTYKYYPFGKMLVRYNNDNSNLVNDVYILSGENKITLKESNVEFNIDSYTTSIVAVATQLYNIIINSSNCEVSMLKQFEPGNKLPVSITANDMCYFNENPIVSKGSMSDITWSTNVDGLNSKIEFTLDTTGVYEDITLTSIADTYSRYNVNTTLPDYVQSSNTDAYVLSINDYETTFTSVWGNNPIRYDAIDLDNISIKSGSNTLDKSQYEFVGENSVSINGKTLYTSATLNIPAENMSGDISITVNVKKYTKLYAEKVENCNLFINDENIDNGSYVFVPMDNTFNARYSANSNTRVKTARYYSSYNDTIIELSTNNTQYVASGYVLNFEVIAIEQITITMNSKLATESGYDNSLGYFSYNGDVITSKVVDKNGAFGNYIDNDDNHFIFTAIAEYEIRDVVITTPSGNLGESCYTKMSDTNSQLYNMVYFHFAENTLDGDTNIIVNVSKITSYEPARYRMNATLANETNSEKLMVANMIGNDGNVASGDLFLDGDKEGHDLKEMFDYTDKDGNWKTVNRNLISKTDDEDYKSYNSWNLPTLYYTIPAKSSSNVAGYTDILVDSSVYGKDNVEYMTEDHDSTGFSRFANQYGIMVKVKLDGNDTNNYAIKVMKGAHMSGSSSITYLPVYDNIESKNIKPVGPNGTENYYGDGYRYVAFFINNRDNWFEKGITTAYSFILTTDTENGIYPNID